MGCSFCDTDYSEKEQLSTTDIVRRIQTLLNGRLTAIKPLVVITGGEPLEQDLNSLLATLTKLELQVQLETNGSTLYDKYNSSLLEQALIVCSPKHEYIDIRLAHYIDAYKILVSDETYFRAESIATLLALTEKPIYIQPINLHGLGLVNKQNLEAAIKLCKKYNFVLSPQLHKLIGEQ